MRELLKEAEWEVASVTIDCSREARTSWSQDKSRNARYDSTPGPYGLELIVRMMMVSGRVTMSQYSCGVETPGRKAAGSSHPHNNPLDVEIRPRVVKYVGPSHTAAGSRAGAQGWALGLHCTHCERFQVKVGFTCKCQWQPLGLHYTQRAKEW